MTEKRLNRMIVLSNLFILFNMLFMVLDLYQCVFNIDMLTVNAAIFFSHCFVYFIGISVIQSMEFYGYLNKKYNKQLYPNGKADLGFYDLRLYRFAKAAKAYDDLIIIRQKWASMAILFINAIFFIVFNVR